MVARPAGRQWFNSLKPELTEIELIDKHIDHPHRIVGTDPVVQLLRKQRALAPIHAFNETLHDTLPPKHTGIIGSKKSAVDVFTHGVTRGLDRA